MDHLPLPVQVVWSASIAAQAVLWLTLVVKKHYRNTPVFTAYITLNLAQAFFLFTSYAAPGNESRAYYLTAWITEAVTLLFRALATLEILRLVLFSYRGIWGLAWRFLATVYSLVLLAILIVGPDNVVQVLIRADRGYLLIFAFVLVACLILVRYYRISVIPIYKLVLIGFCAYSCSRILLDTYLQTFFARHFDISVTVWQTSSLLCFVVILVLWTVALSKPAPVMVKNRVLLPSSVYARVAPAINHHLGLINEQLVQFWKLEKPQP